MPQISRRDAITTGLFTLAGCSISQACVANDTKSTARHQDVLTLGFSSYGMKSLKIEEAIQQIARIGFDAVEITVWPGWDAEPGNLTMQRRQEVRNLLSDTGLQLTSLMEHILPSQNTAEHAKHLIRLKDVFELAVQLSPTAPPLVQTVLGGGQWNSKRELVRDRVGDWLEVAEQYDVVLAIKPHRGGVMSRPEEAVWLIEQLDRSRHLKMVYDYSHYAYRDMSIADTVKTALPHLGHVAVKDAVKEGDRIVFRLPGQAGTVPYPNLLRLLHNGGYRGDVSCEVSGMVWSQPG